MHLTSYVFLLAFLPIVVLVYWAMIRSPNARKLFLLAASIVFYLVAAPNYILLLLALVLITYWAASTSHQGLGIAANLLALLSVKYLGMRQLPFLPTSWVLLPGLSGPAFAAGALGVSFYVFKHIGYLIDTRQGTYPHSDRLVTFAAFSTYFPQITAGPISAFSDTGAQLEDLPKSFQGESVYRGLGQIGIGLAKKVAVANILLAQVQPWLLTVDHQRLGLVQTWLALITFGTYIYFDFSAYTDMALGISRLFGIRLPANFDNPYLSKSPGEFWRKWHMTLTGWLTSYVYIPLVRRSVTVPALARSRLLRLSAMVLALVLVGLWHGASTGYLLFGLYHGVLLFIWPRTWPAGKGRFKPIAEMILLNVFVLLGWSFFMTQDLAVTVALLRGGIGLNGLSLPDQGWSMPILAWSALGFGIVMIISGRAEAANLVGSPSPWKTIAFSILIVLGLLMLGSGPEFLYAQF